MKYNFWLLVITFFISMTYTFGQATHSQYFQGYEKDVSGTRFGYHSPLPEVNTSLLIRGREDYAPIEWESEVVPENYNQVFIHFIWLFGMDVVSDPATFFLDVNGKRWFTFNNSTTSETGPVIFKGEDGAELTFKVTMLDKYEDQMGFAILKLPVSALKKGVAQTFRVATDTRANNAWYMTFKSPVLESINIYQNKVVVKKESRLWHSISADFVHIGAPQQVQLSIADQTLVIDLQPGYNKAEMDLPMVNDTTYLIATIQKGDAPPIPKPIILAPIREWTIYLVQHTHTDIGYTRPQQEILPEHLRYIDMALDFCDQTDHYPEDAKFRWTCETSWSVREYLESRPKEQVERLIRRIKEGRIEATGMFLNFSEITDEPAMAMQTKTLHMLKSKGIDVTTAMQNDVNGIAWCMVDYYQHTDVRYLTMGIHAHRARKPFDKPTSFWWESPAGNRLMAYRSEHYQHGNALSLTTGQQDVFRSNLSQYLSKLETKNYPYNRISLQFSGYITDNSPPSAKVCDIINAWNEKYEWPKLKSALARDFMVWLDEQHADDLPVHQAAWPDWWTDGVASAAHETQIVRKTQSQMTAITGVLAMLRMMNDALPEGTLKDIRNIYDNLLFYDEHTHGAAESVSDPRAKNTINQWSMKSAYAWEAFKKAHALEEKALAYFEPLLEQSHKPTITVFNTLNWMRSGLVELFIQNEVIPEGIDFTITDSDQQEIAWQRIEQRMEGAYYVLWVKDIPPVGYKTLQINLDQQGAKNRPDDGKQFENNFYQLVINEECGVISSLYDKTLNNELIDPADTLSMGQMIYEQLTNRHDLERLTNNNRDTVYRPLDLKRSLLQNIEITDTRNGAIYKSIFLHGDLPVCADERGVDLEIRLYHYEKKIQFLYRMFKLPVTDPEGLYVAFPFVMDEGELAYEVQGGVVMPGINQIEGTASDWNTIQNFAAVRNSKEQIVFISPDIPLVQFGDINTGHYYFRLRPKTNHVFSWVLNNYWVTNFKASQEGELQWSYTITSGPDASTTSATRFGWGERIPLLSRVIMPQQGSNGTIISNRSFLTLDAPNLLLVSTTPAMEGNGVILQIRETEGNHAHIDINALLMETGAVEAFEANVLEENLNPITTDFLIEHNETKFIRLVF
ncbi:MAG: hypothetical protein KQI35_02120 [Bacteroidetes bacterium]|nr:hypothetical protein [Bacteroidota bacterium]